MARGSRRPLIVSDPAVPEDSPSVDTVVETVIPNSSPVRDRLIVWAKNRLYPHCRTHTPEQIVDEILSVIDRDS